MENKKQLVSLIIICALSLFSILVTLFLPIADVVSKNMSTAEIIPEASGTFGLITFSQSMLIIADVCYNASGPAWLPILGIALNWIVVIAIFMLICFAVFDLFTLNKETLTLKQNAITKKLALIVSYFALFVFIFEIITFVLTTALSHEYFIYTPNYGIFLTAGCFVGMLVCAYMLNKKQTENQNTNKVRDSVGYSLTIFSVILFVVFIFVPQTVDGLSLFNVSMLANSIGHYPYIGEYFVGISQWVTFLMAIPVLVLLTNCLRGINNISRKNNPKILKSVRRWCVVWAIWTLLYLFLMSASIIIVYGAFWADNIAFISPLSIFMVMFAFAPCLINSMISTQTPNQYIEKTLSI